MCPLLRLCAAARAHFDTKESEQGKSKIGSALAELEEKSISVRLQQSALITSEVLLWWGWKGADLLP